MLHILKEVRHLIYDDECSPRGISRPKSKNNNSNRFGRMFPDLPPFPRFSQEVRMALLQLGKKGGIMDQVANNIDNPNILAGFTFFGQFIDHDITFDPTSSFDQQNDPEAN